MPGGGRAPATAARRAHPVTSSRDARDCIRKTMEVTRSGLSVMPLLRGTELAQRFQAVSP